MPRTDKKLHSTANSELEPETACGLDPIDVLVGCRVRLRRTSAGMSDEQLATAVGITVPRIQACERGEKRIGANLLYEISLALDCLPMVFFENM
jgi:ribosome-binding protein aMBF1 (putative translation factor)